MNTPLNKAPAAPAPEEVAAGKTEPLFPVYLNMQELQTLLVGGGNAALGQLSAILEANPRAQVRLVTPEASAELRRLAVAHPRVELVQREFQEEDLEGVELALLATEDLLLDKAIHDLARSRGVLVSKAGAGATPASAAKPKVREELAVPVPRILLKYNLTSVLVLAFSAIALMVTGHLLFSYIPLQTIGNLALDVAAQIDSDILIFILAGFVAQLIDGALGMAYGVSATTFLLSVGVSPVAASASVHASEIFTSGVSGWMHLKFRNVNNKLFKNIVLPGVLGAILGAYLLYTFEEYLYVIKPLVAAYILVLGILILRKVLRKKVKKKPVKKLGFLATAGGFLDAIGGGGWGPIVSSTLIAKGRNPMYTIGSVNLAEFFVSIASSATFVAFAGISHWQIILGLILGGCISAPIGAMMARRLPVKTMMIIVGIVVIIVSLRLIVMALPF